MRELTLCSGALNLVRSHALNSLPNEAVGLLGGDENWIFATAVPLCNRRGAGEFFVDPYEQFLAERAIKEMGFSVLAVYHSHPYGGTEPSKEDLVFARVNQRLQIILAINFATQSDTEPVMDMSAYQVVRDKLRRYRIRLSCANSE